MVELIDKLSSVLQVEGELKSLGRTDCRELCSADEIGDRGNVNVNHSTVSNGAWNQMQDNSYIPEVERRELSVRTQVSRLAQQNLDAIGATPQKLTITVLVCKPVLCLWTDMGVYATPLGVLIG